MDPSRASRAAVSGAGSQAWRARYLSKLQVAGPAQPPTAVPLEKPLRESLPLSKARRGSESSSASHETGSLVSRGSSEHLRKALGQLSSGGSPEGPMVRKASPTHGDRLAYHSALLLEGEGSATARRPQINSPASAPSAPISPIASAAATSSAAMMLAQLQQHQENGVTGIYEGDDAVGWEQHASSSMPNIGLGMEHYQYQQQYQHLRGGGPGMLPQLLVGTHGLSIASGASAPATPTPLASTRSGRGGGIFEGEFDDADGGGGGFGFSSGGGGGSARSSSHQHQRRRTGDSDNGLGLGLGFGWPPLSGRPSLPPGPSGRAVNMSRAAGTGSGSGRHRRTSNATSASSSASSDNGDAEEDEEEDLGRDNASEAASSGVHNSSSGGSSSASGPSSSATSQTGGAPRGTVAGRGGSSSSASSDALGTSRHSGSGSGRRERIGSLDSVESSGSGLLVGGRGQGYSASGSGSGSHRDDLSSVDGGLSEGGETTSTGAATATGGLFTAVPVPGRPSAYHQRYGGGAVAAAAAAARTRRVSGLVPKEARGHGAAGPVGSPSSTGAGQHYQTTPPQSFLLPPPAGPMPSGRLDGGLARPGPHHGHPDRLRGGGDDEDDDEEEGDDGGSSYDDDEDEDVVGSLPRGGATGMGLLMQHRAAHAHPAAPAPPPKPLQLAAVPAAHMPLAPSFVPPHILAANAAANGDPFSMGMHAQIKPNRLNNLV